MQVLPAQGSPKRVNLTLQGGGVLGIAEVGAVCALRDAGYTFASVTGTSVGAIVAAFVASGVDNGTLKELVSTLPYPKVMDPNSWLARIPIAGRVVSWFWYGGSYKGDFLENWVEQKLQEHAGVRTFGDLAAKIQKGEASPLAMVTFDADRQLETVLPRDYGQFHRDPSQETIASAVRASTSILTFFQPAVITDPVSGEHSACYDGGLVNNYPWDIAKHADPTARTIGIRLESPSRFVPIELKGFAAGVKQLLAVITGIGKARENRLMEDPEVVANTIAPPTFGISEQDFKITPAQCEKLYAEGYQTAKEWIARDLASQQRGQRTAGEQLPELPKAAGLE